MNTSATNRTQLLAPIARGLSANHNETLLAASALAPAAVAAGA
jgi:hypothetical protein